MKRLRGPKDNLYESLHRQGFKNSKVFRRQTAFFQPSVFKCWGPSLNDIIKNNIKLEILMAVAPNNIKILNAINKLETEKQRQNYLLREANSIFENSLELAVRGSYKNRTRLIRYLYAKGQLELKLSISCDENKENLSLSHEKIGYFLNDNGDFISFEGSANESESALLRNGETVMIFNSNDPNDRETALKQKKELDEKWLGQDLYSIVCSPSDEITQRIKESVGIKDDREFLKVVKEFLDEENISTEEEEEEILELRNHQKDAIKAWIESKYRGILNHATGSGKTFTAIQTISKLRKGLTGESLVVLIGVPFIPLADQWIEQLDVFFKKEIKKNKFVYNGAIGCYSSSEEENWKLSLDKELQLFKSSISRKNPHLTIVVAVNDSLSSEKFQSSINNAKINRDRLFVIGDECHRYGSSKNLLDSLPDGTYRMGLSATPFDSDIKSKNEEEMDTYFGGICHNYSLKDGIRDGHLSNYYYYPKACYLDDEEFLKWKEYLDAGDSNDEHITEMEKIIDGSNEKYNYFSRLIRKDKDIEHSIVFSGQGKKEEISAIDYVSKILTKNDWTHQQITYKESQKQRKEIIQGFKKGDIKAICAIRVLDEGIDIPVIKKAYILASSASRRQFVQRRGRVLRKNFDKEYAEIYDFVILPNTKFGDSGRNLIEREMNRVTEMGEDALNKVDVDEFVKKYRGLYELS